MQAKLIDDLLDMNRLMSGTFNSKSASSMSAACCRRRCRGCSRQPTPKACSYRVRRAHGGQIAADARRLQQVLWNLVHNAIKFTPKGGRVEIHVHHADGRAAGSRARQRPGDRAAFLPLRVRAVSSGGRDERRAKRVGLGLGLSIAKQIIELHGGSIAALSGGEGKGSTFVVRVPTNATVSSEDHQGAAEPGSGERSVSA